MKKCFFIVSLLLVVGAFLSACDRECVCTTTYKTVTLNESKVSEMGKMSAKHCEEYNGSYEESDGVLRTVTCELD